jgi:serine/threonine-protein kinase
MVEAHGADLDLRNAELGPYTIVRRLGVGGMAETFEAIRHGSEGFTQRVCLKLALPFLREDEAYVRLFQREARLAAKLRHGNIVGVLDYGNVAGTPYMALELVDGVDLSHLLEQEGALGAAHVALLAIELAKGLNHAHDLPSAHRLDDGGTDLGGIVHRDVSPSNIMLSQQGEVMLTDFGLAKAMSGASRHQSAVKGKIPYMSPEQLRNESLDGRSDLFSLGVVLYECLSGSRPYDAGNDPATIMRILNGERIPLHEVAHEAPPELCTVIDGLLEPERDARPASASELMTQLDPLAPSPRAQRDLGAVVTELRRESLERFREVEGKRATAPMDRAAAQSGVVPSVVGPESSPKEAPEPEDLRVNASAVLAVAIVAAMLVGIVLFVMRLI